MAGRSTRSNVRSSAPRDVTARAVVLSFVIALALAACTSPLESRPEDVDWAETPQTIFTTDDFPVGSSYTVGSLSLPPDAEYPVVVTGIEVLRTEGVRVLGTRAYTESAGDSIGLVPSWDPSVLGGDAREPSADSAPFTAGSIGLVVGIETVADRSGLRGLRATWHDGVGSEHVTTFDLAVVTCALGACAEGQADDESLVRELGLVGAGR